MEKLHVGREIRMLCNLCKRYSLNQSLKLTKDEFTSMHMWMLHYLYLNKDKDIFQKDFENEFTIRRSTASNILGLMEKRKLIKRVSVKTDARLKKIVLTENGQKLHDEFGKVIEANEKVYQKGISKKDLEVFFKVSEQIKKNVEEKC